MKVTLQPITSANWIDAIALKPTDEQARIGFVAPNSVSLAQSHYEPWWQPCGLSAMIVGQATMVGFAMYGRWPATGISAHHDDAKPGIDFTLRFMIDARYQGQGYGPLRVCTRTCRSKWALRLVQHICCFFIIRSVRFSANWKTANPPKHHGASAGWPV